MRILNFTTFKVYSVNDSSFREWVSRLSNLLHIPRMHSAFESNTWSPEQIHPLPGPPRQNEFLVLGKYFNSQINKNSENMFELGFSDVLSMAQTIGIVGTMIMTLYFSRRQIQSLSLDVETKVLNDLGEKIHRMGEMVIERPELGRVITDIQADRWSVELPFAYYVLYICSHAYDMRERNVLNDNEWAGWLQWMRNCFQQGTIKEHWRRIESEKWFDPSFQNFINKDVLAAS